MAFEYGIDHVTLYPPEMYSMLDSPQGEVGEHLYRVGMLMVAGAKRQVGVKTGHLKTSIGMDHNRDLMGQYIRVGSDVHYALDHHQGTPAHWIFPNGHPFLRFSNGGRVTYARGVHIPAIAPNHYLSDQLYLVRI